MTKHVCAPHIPFILRLSLDCLENGFFFQVLLITFKAFAGLSGSNINMTSQGADLSLRSTDLQIKLQRKMSLLTLIDILVGYC